MKTCRILSLLIAASFLLGVHDGYVALWKDGDPTPRVFPYRAELLPEADRKRLETGISIADEAELHRLMEDYLS